MFPTLLRRTAKEALPKRVPLSIANNPHRARKVWPPDFKDLNSQQQLRFEKKWKRRMNLASHSPRWIKAVKYAQLVTIAGALVWLCFYAEFEWWGRKYTPSEELRRKATYLFGILDPDKRNERRRDAPEAPPQPEATESKESRSK